MTGPQFFETGMGQKFYEGTMPRLIEAIKGLADILDTPKESTAGGEKAHLSEYQHQLVIRGQEAEAAELTDLSFMDDMDNTTLKEELIKRVQLIEQLRAHRDALLNQLADACVPGEMHQSDLDLLESINHPPSPDTGVVRSGK